MIPIILALLAMRNTPTTAYDMPRIEERYTVAEGDQRDPQSHNSATQAPAPGPQVSTKPQDCSSADNAKTVECQDAEDNQRIAIANEHMVILTLVIAGVGVVQTIALVLTLKATQKAADATAESVRLSERSLKITERAHLQIDQIKLPSALKIGDIPRIIVSIANRGRTPATIISGVSKFDIFDEIPETPTFEDESPGHILVGPGSSVTQDVRTQHAVTLDEMRAVNAGEKHFVVWGRMLYLDVFGDRHEMRFGARLKFHDENPANRTYTVSFKQLTNANYNRAD